MNIDTTVQRCPSGNRCLLTIGPRFVALSYFIKISGLHFFLACSSPPWPGSFIQHVPLFDFHKLLTTFAFAAKAYMWQERKVGAAMAAAVAEGEGIVEKLSTYTYLFVSNSATPSSGAIELRSCQGQQSALSRTRFISRFADARLIVVVVSNWKCYT